jgi:hypothetical protein
MHTWSSKLPLFFRFSFHWNIQEPLFYSRLLFGFFALKPLANVHHTQFMLSRILFYALWLAQLQYADRYLLYYFS